MITLITNIVLGTAIFYGLMFLYGMHLSAKDRNNGDR